MPEIFELSELASYMQIDEANLNTATATLVRELATTMIRGEVGAARYDRITDLSVFKPVALELAKRLYQNPAGVRQEQAAIDDYNRSVTYATETAAPPELTADERRRLRRAVGLRSAFSIRPEPPTECPVVPPCRLGG